MLAITMWLSYNSIGPFGLRYAESLGRALALAQSFEANCKYVLLIANLDDEIAKKKIDSLKDVRNYSERLEEWFKLGGAVTQFKERHRIQDKDIATLREGTSARNYIAHKAGHSLLLGEASDKEIVRELENYQSRVFQLANAENLISQWSYVIQEKAVPPRGVIMGFPQQVSAWVLSPLGS